jgi:hypothetical protein
LSHFAAQTSAAEAFFFFTSVSLGVRSADWSADTDAVGPKITASWIPADHGPCRELSAFRRLEKAEPGAATAALPIKVAKSVTAKYARLSCRISSSVTSPATHRPPLKITEGDGAPVVADEMWSPERVARDLLESISERDILPSL